MAVMVIGKIWYTIRAFVHSNFNNVKGFQFVFFSLAFVCPFRMPLQVTRARTTTQKSANLLVNFAAGTNASTKHLNATQWLRFGVTMVIINSTVWWNASTMPSASTVRRPNAGGVCQCITFTCYVVPVLVIPMAKWFCIDAYEWMDNCSNHKSVRMSVCILSRFSRWLSVACFRVFVFISNFIHLYSIWHWRTTCSISMQTLMQSIAAGAKDQIECTFCAF